jgi:ABC-type multidrug transport system fused ATPase/permease subunit
MEHSCDARCRLRAQMGLVSQEPVLFQGTIAENIAWGRGDMSTITMDEIIAVCLCVYSPARIPSFPRAVLSALRL